MRDISKKTKTLRTAVATATLMLKRETIELIRQNRIPKGDPLTVAKVAAIQAAKSTSQLIPYCHPVPLDFIDCRFEVLEERIEIKTEVKAIYKTGVEMEALSAVSVAALTLYDMMKMLDDTMEIVGVRLVSKQGGKSDFREIFDRPLRAAVLVMSDSIASGKKDDLSGRLIVERLHREGVEVPEYKVISDDTQQIQRLLIQYSDELKMDLVLTTGGTGFSPRDFSPEAVHRIVEREIPGIPEALRAYGQERTPYSMLSRGVAGIRGTTIVVNLPGSKKGVADSLDALFPAILHSFKMLWGGGHQRQEKKAKEGQKRIVS
jgi:molybdenum cofactor biosynthesis protein MoaC